MRKLKKKYPSAPLILPAPAKVNLWLKVGGKHKDGYHSIQTEFQEISLVDRLKFKLVSSPGIHLKCSNRALPKDSKNLVVLALTHLREKLKATEGIQVELFKQIPVGSGLGGGSSDAATALWGGWILWKKKKVSSFRHDRVPEVLKKIARKCGADVPFFLKGGRALAKGIGDRLKYLPSRRRRWMVLIYPGRGVPTPYAYQALDRLRASHSQKSSPRNSELPINHFEPVILPRFKEIDRAHKFLSRLGCQDVLMSGSGSSVFGFVKSPGDGWKVIRRIPRKKWKVFLLHTV